MDRNAGAARTSADKCGASWGGGARRRFEWMCNSVMDGSSSVAVGLEAVTESGMKRVIRRKRKETERKKKRKKIGEGRRADVRPRADDDQPSL